MPASSIDQPAAEDRPADRSEQHRYAENRHEAAHPLRPGRPGNDHHSERHQHAAAKALQHSEANQHVDVGGHGAKRGASGEQRERGHIQALGSEPVGSPARDRDDGGQREGVAGDRPRDRGVGERMPDRPERGLERRKGDVDDRDIDDRHDRAEDNNPRDLEDVAGNPVAVRGTRNVRHEHLRLSDPVGRLGDT
jgi:hypothetical protein